MAEHYFSTNIDNETTLCIAPLTNRRLAMSGQEISDTSGYFLYEKFVNRKTQAKSKSSPKFFPKTLHFN